MVADILTFAKSLASGYVPLGRWSSLPPGASGADQIQVGIGTLGACPAGTQAVVATFTPGDGFLKDDPFFVMFWS